MSNNQTPIPDLSTLDREALARMVAHLQQENERLKQENAAEIDEFNAGFQAAAAGLDLESAQREYYDVLPQDAPRFDVFGVGYAWAVFEKLRAELDRHRRSAELQEQARKADACTECKGTGEIGYINQTELGPEGDSSECDACFGSGSQKMANRIGEFFAQEFAVFVEMSELLATKAEIPRDEFESESGHITRAIERLVDEAAKDYADMRRFQGDVIRLAHENGNLAERLAAARAEVERLTVELKQEVATSERVLMQNNSRWAQLVGKLAGENDALRAALAQVGDAVKARAVEIADTEADKYLMTDGARSAEARHVATLISRLDLAAIVAASAETTNEPRALVRFGWTETVIETVADSAIRCRGGEVDGLSFGLGAIPGAQAGETWLVKLAPRPPFAFGEIVRAVRLTGAAAEAQEGDDGKTR